MGMTYSLIAELDEAIQSGSSDRRMATLRRVTDLFLSQEGLYDSEQIGLFDDVLLRLIEHIETRALAELGERLAPVEAAPVGIIRHLANHDEIAVAGPVLKDSKRLSPPDLVEIASAKSQDHLLAISQRAEIDEMVTDVLVDRGSREVARTVALNSGARFSPTGFTTLVKRAEQDDVLAELAGQRADLPPQLFAQLLAKATETVKAKLTASLRPEAADDVAHTLNKVARELQAQCPVRDYAEALGRMKLVQANGRLDESIVLETAKADQFEETAAALALLCSVPVELIDRLMQGTRIDALLIPCKASGLGWPATKAVVRLTPAQGKTSEAAFEIAKKDFANLSEVAARRIMRFWQVRASVSPDATLSLMLP
jgi:uncharacterized protein (DUF2336 family)